jgi:hypothetical protein
LTSKLTAGLDTVNGTANNDTINALASGVTSTGGNATTLGANDTIDGGAGYDTLNIESLSAAQDAAQNGVARNTAIVGTIKNVEKVVISGSDNISVNNNRGQIDASLFTGNTLETIVLKGTSSAATDVANLAANQGVVHSGQKGTNAGVNNSQTYVNTATSGVVGLDNTTGTVTVTGAKLDTVKVDGTVYSAPVTTANVTIGSVTLVDGSATDTVKTLNLELKSDATVSVAGMTALTAINAANSTGNINLGTTVGAKAATITLGSGADNVTVVTATNKAATGVTAINASVAGGAGNDAIVVKTTGDGDTTVNGDAGNDTITLDSTATGKFTVNGGEGNDTINVKSKR